jgi:hypothetical protein
MPGSGYFAFSADFFNSSATSAHSWANTLTEASGAARCGLIDRCHNSQMRNLRRTDTPPYH